MNKIEWKIDEEYDIDDIQTSHKGKLIGFIVNQIPVNWKNQNSYCNRPSNNTYLVFEAQVFGEKKYVSAIPSLHTYLTAPCDSPYSSISLYGINYSDTIESLILKLKENWVFTKELSYNARYEEGFISK